MGLSDIELLKYKDDVLAAFIDYKALRKKQSSCQLKFLHINEERKYMGEFDDYFKENVIIHKVTTSYLFEQNSKAKKINHTIIGPVRAIFTQKKLFKSLWAQIAKTILYLRNRSPICHSNITIYNNLKSEKPCLGNLHIL